MLCWRIALCFQRGESLIQEQKNCLSPVLVLAWPAFAQIWWYQCEVVQPPAMRTRGFPGLAASQQSSLMHETEQVTYSEHCMGLFLVHVLGTRKHSVPRSTQFVHFCSTFFGECVWGILRGIAACLRLCFFSRYSGAELSFLVHCVYWSKSNSSSMNLCFKREKSQRKINCWEWGEY